MNDEQLRELVPATIGVLVRRGADFASAEDAVQEALITALRTWDDDPPRDPMAWLVTVAWRKFLDGSRSAASRRDREDLVAAEGPYAALLAASSRLASLPHAEALVPAA